MRLVARMDNDVRLCIDRLTLRQQFLDPVRQRTVAAPFGALDQHFDIGLQPYGNALDVDQVARALIHYRAAAGRQHLRSVFQQARDDSRLAGTEIGLTVFSEDFGNAHAGGAFNLGIGIDERDAEPRGKPPPNRGLARPHHADEHDGTPPERAEQYAVCSRIGAIFSRLLDGAINHGSLPNRWLVPYTSNCDALASMPSLFRLLVFLGLF